MFTFLRELSAQRTTSDVTPSLSPCLRQGLSVLVAPWCSIPDKLKVMD